jgi:fibronectin-binding autotransporter adhesin
LFAVGTAAVVNQGLIRNTSGGSLSIGPRVFTNLAGTNPDGGAVRAESGTIGIATSTNLTNFSAGTLTGGTWEVWGGATLDFGTRSIVTLAPGTTVVFNGPGVFSALDTLATNNGTLRVLGGKSFNTVPGSLNNAGVLEVGTGSTVYPAVNVQAGGRLQGGGTVVGAVTVGGTIAPGSAAAPVGRLATGGQTWAGGGQYEVSYSRNTGTFVAGTDNDYLNATGSLTVTATPANKFHLHMHYAGPPQPGAPQTSAIKIATFAGGAPPSFDLNAFQLEGDLYVAGSAFNLTSVGNDVLLTFTPVPEPGAMLLVAAAGSGAFVVVRRLRQRGADTGSDPRRLDRGGGSQTRRHNKLADGITDRAQGRAVPPVPCLGPACGW